MSQEKGHFESLDEWAEQHKLTADEWVNPMVRKAGKGPAGAKCKTCSHLIKVQGNTKDYLKCELRGITKGVGTDHRAKWPACKRYEIEPNQIG